VVAGRSGRTSCSPLQTHHVTSFFFDHYFALRASGRGGGVCRWPMRGGGRRNLPPVKGPPALDRPYRHGAQRRNRVRSCLLPGRKPPSNHGCFLRPLSMACGTHGRSDGPGRPSSRCRFGVARVPHPQRRGLLSGSGSVPLTRAIESYPERSQGWPSSPQEGHRDTRCTGRKRGRIKPRPGPMEFSTPGLERQTRAGLSELTDRTVRRARQGWKQKRARGDHCG